MYVKNGKEDILKTISAFLDKHEGEAMQITQSRQATITGISENGFIKRKAGKETQLIISVISK